MCVFVYVCTKDDVDDVDDGKDEPSVREHYLVRCALCEQIRTSARRSREKTFGGHRVQTPSQSFCVVNRAGFVEGNVVGRANEMPFKRVLK